MNPSQDILRQALEILIDYSNEPKGSPYYTELYDHGTDRWWMLSSLYSNQEKMTYWKLRLLYEPVGAWLAMAHTQYAIAKINLHLRGEAEGYGSW